MNRTLKSVTRALLSVVVATAITSTSAVAYEVREIGSFYIGGRVVTLAGLPSREIVFTPGAPPVRVDPNGEFDTGQMYVQYVKLVRPSFPVPLLMWHGGGLTGATWETTPDGRAGWQQYFLNAGYDLYVSDAVERGRASWSRYPEVYASEPFFRGKSEAWTLFRLGPSYKVGGDRQAYPDSQFPAAAFDKFTQQFVPRWASNDAATQAAYDAEIAQIGPCVVLMHSQGANFGFVAALHAPNRVKAIVAIEPSGFPDPKAVDLTVLKRVPHLFVFGDHLTGPFWEKVHANAQQYAEALSKAGVPVTFVDLPSRGIVGNSHMLMMDHNSDEIAQIVSQWLKDQVKP